MSKVDLSFIQSIIDGSVEGAYADLNAGLISEDEYEYVESVLLSVKRTVTQFVKDANKLTSNDN